MITAASDLPDYVVRINEDNVQLNGGRDAVVVKLTVSVSLRHMTSPSESRSRKSKSLGMTSFLAVTSDNCFIDFRRIPCVPFLYHPWYSLTVTNRTKSLADEKSYTLSVPLEKPSQTVIVHVHPVCVLRSRRWTHADN